MRTGFMPILIALAACALGAPAAAPPPAMPSPPAPRAEPAEPPAVLEPLVPPAARASTGWTAIAEGIAYRDMGEQAGDNVFVGYAGYAVGDDLARAWVARLYDDALARHGVRHLYAVRGPEDSHYKGHEIPNRVLAARLVRDVSPTTRFIAIVAHSSGSFVAHELLRHLTYGADPGGATAGRIVYYDLDGALDGLTPASVARLGRAFFVSARDTRTGTASPNARDMQTGAALYGGTFVAVDADEAGCERGASWCLHTALITTHPHNPRAASPQLDYGSLARSGTHATVDYLSPL